jgi:uncharacterized protein with GYD domain
VLIWEATKMSLYMTQAKRAPEAWRAICVSPRDRREVLSEMLQAAGRKLHDYFFAFGDADVILIMEAPDHETAAWAAIAIARAGAVTDVRTTVLLTYEQGVRAIERSAEMGYIPPGQVAVAATR